MKGEFVVLKNGILETYSNYEDIPEDFDNVIKFLPEPIPGPHTEEQHAEMDTWNDKLQRLMQIERRNKNASRL